METALSGCKMEILERRYQALIEKKERKKRTAMEYHNVYVIELDKKVATVSKFMKGNEQYDGTMPCVYVGLTGLTPEERFQNHKKGHKSCKFVTLYGLCLMPNLYVHLNPMEYDDAVKTEKDLAEQLRVKGYGVWQR